MTSNQTTRIWVHTGALSQVNGNPHPISTFLDLGNILDTSLGEGYETSDYVGRDYLVVSNDNVQTVADILTESKMVFAIDGTSPWGHWQNASSKVLSMFPEINR